MAPGILALIFVDLVVGLASAGAPAVLLVALHHFHLADLLV